MEHPSTPGAPLLSLTFSHACHTSAFEISNGLPDDFSSLTRLLPDLSPVDRTNMPRMTWPLRSTPTATAGTSPLLRASPPAHPHRYSIPPAFGRKGLSLSPPWWGGSIGPRFLPFHTSAAWSGSRRLYAGHHLANRRAPARLIPGSGSNPGSGVNRSYFDTS